MCLLNGHLKLLFIDVSARGIALRGNCDSFHSKHMAQEIVTKSSRLRILSNDLVVNELSSVIVASEQLNA